MKKHTDNIDMSFTAEQPTPEGIPQEKVAETYEREGVVIYKKDENGFMQFYDGEGNAIDDGVVEKVSDAYKPAPYINDRGDEQDGGLRVRYIKQTPQMGTVKNEETDLQNCTIIEKRQYYKNGEAVIQTIPKKFYNLVKYLNGEYDDAQEKVEEEKKIEEV